LRGISGFESGWEDHFTIYYSLFAIVRHWLLLTMLLGLRRKLERFWRRRMRSWIYFERKERVSGFHGIAFASPDGMTAN
jgi:hypothetical protein